MIEAMPSITNAEQSETHSIKDAPHQGFVCLSIFDRRLIIATQVPFRGLHPPSTTWSTTAIKDRDNRYTHNIDRRSDRRLRARERIPPPKAIPNLSPAKALIKINTPNRHPLAEHRLKPEPINLDNQTIAAK